MISNVHIPYFRCVKYVEFTQRDEGIDEPQPIANGAQNPEKFLLRKP
jgi:hypothetical protein